MRTTLSLVLLAGLASASLADIPAALDRVPLETPMIVAMDNVAAAKQSMDKLGTLIDGPKVDGEAGMLEPLEKLLALPGLNREGSASVLMYPKEPKAKPAPAPDADDKPEDEFFDENAMHAEDDVEVFAERFDVIALVPVTSARDFAAGLGAQLEDGRGMATVENVDLFLRDIGNGHMAVSQSKAVLDAFSPGEKQLAPHTAMLGEVGRAIAKDDHLLVIANAAMMQATMQDMLQGIAAEAGAGIGMGGAAQALPAIEGAMNALTRDASRFVMGAGLNDSGLWMDMGVQYAEGSEPAAMMQAKGDTPALLTRLPSRPFIVAGAFDMSSPGMKKMLGGVLDANAGMLEGGKQGDAGAPPASPFAMLTQLPELADAWSFMVGENPAGMQTGLLSQSIYCVTTRDTGKYLDTMEELNTAANGASAEGVTYKTKYARAAEDVAGVKADTWEVQTIVDPESPNAMMMNMSQGMMFGGPRMRGYAAGAGDHVVMTMSRSRALFESALAAAKGEPQEGRSFASSKDVQHAATFLPAHRAMEVYVNPRPLLEGFSMMLEQFGMSGFDLPERMSPVAAGAAMQGGGVHARLFVPSDVLITLESVIKSMGDMQADLMAPMDEPGDDSAPRF